MTAIAVVTGISTAAAQPAPEAGSDKPAEPATAPAPAAPAPAPAPAPTTGTVTGTVEAPDLDAPLAGATVTIVGSGGKSSATTDDEGHYTLDAAPGVLHVRADFSGFRSEERVVNVAAGA